MSSGEHAFLPPSGAAHWRACAMWPTMNARYPELEPSPKSAEGTAAHWVLAQMHAGNVPGAGTLAPNHHPVTDEMLDGAELALDYLRKLNVPAWLVEQKVHGKRVHPTKNDGTPDFIGFDGPIIHVPDYKFGHDPVEVFEWWQGINYAGLILEMFGLSDLDYYVHFHIIQPRAHHREGPHRSWKVRASDLRAHLNILQMAAEKATDPAHATATAGPQCEFCPGRHACPEAQRTAYRAADLARMVTPLDLDPHAAGLELFLLKRAAQQLEARITGLEEHVKQMMKAGKPVNLWQIEAGMAREEWTVPDEQVYALGSAMGIPTFKAKPITPNQARERGIDAAVVGAMSRRPHGAFKLVPATTSTARKVFG